MEKKIEYGYVVNLSESTSPGSHCSGLYINKATKASYCNSFGFFLRGHHIQDFVTKNCTRFEYNKQQLQQIKSKVCGMYATCFILHMSNGGTLKQFTDKFSKRFLTIILLRKLQLLFTKFYFPLEIF